MVVAFAEVVVGSVDDDDGSAVVDLVEDLTRRRKTVQCPKRFARRTYRCFLLCRPQLSAAAALLLLLLLELLFVFPLSSLLRLQQWEPVLFRSS